MTRLHRTERLIHCAYRGRAGRYRVMVDEVSARPEPGETNVQKTGPRGKGRGVGKPPPTRFSVSVVAQNSEEYQMDKLTAALLSTMKKEVLDQAIDEAIAALERLRTADLASLLGEQLPLPVGPTPRQATKKRSVPGSREAQVLEVVRPFLIGRRARPHPRSSYGGPRGRTRRDSDGRVECDVEVR